MISQLVDVNQNVPVRDLKATYNKYLKQHDELAVYLDNIEIPYDERMKRSPEHQGLCMRLSRLLTALQNAGVDITRKAVEGFELDEVDEKQDPVKREEQAASTKG